MPFTFYSARKLGHQTFLLDRHAIDTWCERGWASTRGSQCTHTFLTGGILRVPDDGREQMLYDLAVDYRSHGGYIPYALSETNTDALETGQEPGYSLTTTPLLVRLFAEFDVPDGEGWTNEEQVLVAKIFNLTLRIHRQKRGKHVLYVSRKRDLATGQAASNIHIVSSVVVSSLDIGFFYAHLLMNLDRYKPRPSGAWKDCDILDLKVATPNRQNLRMNHALKAKKCSCHFGNDCPLGCENGYHMIRQTYSIAFVMNERGEMDEDRLSMLQDNVVQEWKATSIAPPIRRAHPDSYWRRDPVDKLFVQQPFAPFPPSVNDVPVEHSSASYEQQVSASTIRTLQSIIRSARVEWKDLHVKSARRCGGVYNVLVRGKGETCCLNRVGGHHTSSSIYFVIRKDGWSQRCWGGEQLQHRQSGPCKTYRSPFTPFHPAMSLDDCGEVVVPAPAPAPISLMGQVLARMIREDDEREACDLIDVIEELGCCPQETVDDARLLAHDAGVDMASFIEYLETLIADCGDQQQQ